MINSFEKYFKWDVVVKIANILSAEIMGSGAKDDNCSLNDFYVIPPEKPCVISDILWLEEGWKCESVRQEEWLETCWVWISV